MGNFKGKYSVLYHLKWTLFTYANPYSERTMERIDGRFS